MTDYLIDRGIVLLACFLTLLFIHLMGTRHGR